jgi:hypothetical protein
MQQKQHHSHDERDMNQTAANVKREEPQQPKNNQNQSDYSQHVVLSLFLARDQPNQFVAHSADTSCGPSPQSLCLSRNILNHLFFLLTGLVLRRLLVKSGKEQFRRCGRVDRTIDDDVFGADSLPVQPAVTIAIRTKRRAFQRHPGKQSAGMDVVRGHLIPVNQINSSLFPGFTPAHADGFPVDPATARLRPTRGRY